MQALSCTFIIHLCYTCSMENNENTKSINKKGRKKKIENIFSIIQWTILALCFIFLILLHHSQPFSVKKNAFSIIIFVFLEIDLISLFVRTLLTTKNTKQRILAFFAFIVNGVLLLALYFIGKLDLGNFILFIYNTLFAVFYLIDFALYKTKHKTGKLYNRSLILPSLFVFLLSLLNFFYHTHTNTKTIYLYSLIPMGIILIAFIVLSFTLFKQTYKIYFKSAIAKIGVVFMAVIFAFSIGVTFIDATNCAIKSQITQLECVITRKHFSNNFRGIDSYELYVIINDKEYKINVSSDLYFDKKVNDKLKVNLYRGCLNLNYYESGEGY